MGATWLVQSNMQNKVALAQMLGALRDARILTVSVDLTPFSDDIPLPPSLNADRPVVCWGPGFVPRALAYAQLQPGIWFDDLVFRWSAGREQWGALMLNVDAEIVPFEDALTALCATPVFLRPDHDSKAFNGGSYDMHAPPRLRRAFDAGDVATVMAPLRNVEDEWRFFVVGGAVVASTSYRVRGRPDVGAVVAHEARSVAMDAARIWCPAEVFCLDVGCDGTRYGVIEANCFNASRIYGADIEAVVKSVTGLLEG